MGDLFELVAFSHIIITVQLRSVYSSPNACTRSLLCILCQCSLHVTAISTRRHLQSADFATLRNGMYYLLSLFRRDRLAAGSMKVQNSHSNALWSELALGWRWKVSLALHENQRHSYGASPAISDHSVLPANSTWVSMSHLNHSNAGLYYDVIAGSVSNCF